MKIGLFTGGHQKSSTGIGNYINNIIQNLPVASDNLFIIRHPTGYHYQIPHQIVPFAPKWSNMMLWSWATYIQRNKFQHLNVVHSPTLCLFPKKPHNHYILTIHDIIFKLFPEYCTTDVTRYANRYFQRNLKFADKIISVSHSTKKDLIRVYNVPESKIDVIHEAASEQFQPLHEREITIIKKKYQLPDLFILYVGTIEPRKNIQLILHSFKEVTRKNPEVKLVIAGGLGWKYQQTLTLIDTLNITNKVHLLGYVPESDLPALYNAAKVFVYPSAYEGFGLPPLEAMQCGTPVITSTSSSLPEVMGKEGMTVEPSDIAELNKYLLKILYNDNFYQSQKEYGIERAKMFSWKKAAEKTYQVYEDSLTMSTK